MTELIVLQVIQINKFNKDGKEVEHNKFMYINSYCVNKKKSRKLKVRVKKIRIITKEYLFMR